MKVHDRIKHYRLSCEGRVFVMDGVDTKFKTLFEIIETYHGTLLPCLDGVRMNFLRLRSYK